MCYLGFRVSRQTPAASQAQRPCRPAELLRSEQAAQLAEALQKEFHYTVDEKQRSILLTEDGYEAAEDVLQARAGAVVSFQLYTRDCTSKSAV